MPTARGRRAVELSLNLPGLWNSDAALAWQEPRVPPGVL